MTVPRSERVTVELRPTDGGDDLPTETMTVNMGPSHPATHGTVRIVVEVDGETIRRADVQPGYLHRGFEKECERATYNQIFPYTDRLNYVSPMLNNVGFALAVEKLCGLSAPERARYIRVLVGELSRTADHLTNIGTSAAELGAFTVFFWTMKARDAIYDLLEEVSGARLTHSYVRIGGVAWDLPDGYGARCREVFALVRRTLRDCDALLTDNRIFLDRMQGVGAISPGEAIAWGFTGPCLRSTGVAYDVRKDHPYLVYGELDFEVPVGTRGDNMDRYLVRMAEMEQSLRLCEQVLDRMPAGPVLLDDPRFVLPPKRDAYNSIEGMIAHFKIIMDGVKPPPGEVYVYTEGGNGELGFYVVSDGTGRPWKLRCRPPCFTIVSALPRLLEGRLIADVVPTFGSLNMIGGECDR